MTRKKTLIALGVSCSLGLGAAAFAASTPYPVSVDDSTPWLAHLDRQSSMITWDTHASNAIGSTSMSAGGSVGETVSSLNGESDHTQLSGTTSDEDATLALADQGIYSDFYTVSAVPVIVEEWDYYVISPTAAGEDFYVIDPIAASEDFDFYVLSPGSYSVVTLFPSSSSEAEYSGFDEL